MTDKNEIISLLGEGFHTAFRKVPVKNGVQIHNLITDLPEEDWLGILEFVYDGIKHELKGETSDR